MGAGRDHIGYPAGFKAEDPFGEGRVEPVLVIEGRRAWLAGDQFPASARRAITAPGKQVVSFR